MPENPFESAHEAARDTREELKNLKKQIETKNSAESAEDRNTRIQEQFSLLVEPIAKLRDARKALEGNSTLKASEKYAALLAMEESLIQGIDASAPGISIYDVLKGVSDKDMDLGALGEHLKSTDIEDEIAALGGVVSIEEKIKGILDSTGFSERMAGFGITVSQAMEFIMVYLTSMMDGVGPLRGLSKGIKESIAIKKAKGEGIADEHINEGKKKWEIAYIDWMKKDPESAGQAPDLYGEILKAQETAGSPSGAPPSGPSEEVKTKFKNWVNVSDIFGSGVAVEVTGTEATAVLDGSTWKISLPPDAFTGENDANFALAEKGNQLKKLIDTARSSPSISKVTVGSPLELKQLAAGSVSLRATMDSAITDSRLAAVRFLNPDSGSFKSLTLMGDDARIDSLTPLADFDNGKLSVNYATLDITDVNQLTKLGTKAKNATSTTGKWKFESGEWITA